MFTMVLKCVPSKPVLAKGRQLADVGQTPTQRAPFQRVLLERPLGRRTHQTFDSLSVIVELPPPHHHRLHV